MDQYEVFPKGDGWNWRLRKSSRSVQTGDGYDSRGDAIAAARAESDGTNKLVLLRKDGSLYGELDGPRSAQAGEQTVGIEPASETGDAN